MLGPPFAFTYAPPTLRQAPPPPPPSVNSAAAPAPRASPKSLKAHNTDTTVNDAGTVLYTQNSTQYTGITPTTKRKASSPLSPHAPPAKRPDPPAKPSARSRMKMARKQQLNGGTAAAPTLEDVEVLEGKWLRLKWDDAEWYRAVVLRVLDVHRGEVFLFYPDSSETERC